MLPAEPLEQHLSRLRSAIAERETFCQDAPARALGIGAVDAALSGGLQGATLHEVSAAAPIHLGAAAVFTLALAARANEPHKQALWIATDFGNLETGSLYGPGLDQFGLSTDRLLVVLGGGPGDGPVA